MNHRPRLRHATPRHLVACLGLLSTLLLSGCGKRPPAVNPADVPPQQDTATTTVSDQSADFASTHWAGYVDDQRCQACHEDVHASYAQHSMGRSLAKLDTQYSLPQADKAEFEADGFRYSVLQRDGEWVHRQARIAGDEEVAITEATVTHVVGSGHHGQSFLVNRQGRLFMSPITWYPDEQVWALSPGYEKRNSQFHRPVVEVCLYCHANAAPLQPHTLNRYDDPPFRGHAIGCQRCHGPGEQHIQLHESAAELTSDPIVNPANLSPAERDAVCYQCHLSGAARILKPGKSLYDFRPGQPLHETYTIFSLNQRRDQNASGDTKFVGHAEQMHASQCFQASEGRMGCITCHDPHAEPDAEQRVAFYRQRCLDCHGSIDECAMPEPQRRQQVADDSCIDCHMPRQETEVRHAATTDHTISRRPGEANTASPHTSEPPSRLPFHAFPSDQLVQPSARDQSIALVRIAAAQPDLINAKQMDWAIEQLQAATQRQPTDVEAWEALADLHLAAGQPQQALDCVQRVLQQFPQREEALVFAADLYGGARSPAPAITFWRQAIDVNPWMARYWYQLGRTYARTGQWKQLPPLLQVARERFPTSVGIRQLLIESQLRLNQPEQAEREFEQLRRYRPDDWSKLNDWYRSFRSQADR